MKVQTIHPPTGPGDLKV